MVWMLYDPQTHCTRAFQAFESYFKCLLVNGFGSLHVLNIEFEPADCVAISIHVVSLMCGLLLRGKINLLRRRCVEKRTDHRH
jgi:hypothetical protein